MAKTKKKELRLCFCVEDETEDFLRWENKPVFIARHANEETVEIVEDLIIFTQNAEAIYEFAKVKGAHIHKLEDAIIATKDITMIKKFISDIKGINSKKMYKAVEKLESE